MADWQRETRESSLQALSPAVHEAIAAYAERHDLEHIAADPLLVCQTASTRRKRKLLGGSSAKTQTTSIVVTRELLIWVVETGGDAVAVSARLKEIEVKDFRSDLVQDTGLEVFGFLLGGSERMTAFIGARPGPATDRLKAVLAEAIAAAS